MENAFAILDGEDTHGTATEKTDRAASEIRVARAGAEDTIRSLKAMVDRSKRSQKPDHSFDSAYRAIIFCALGYQH